MELGTGLHPAALSDQDLLAQCQVRRGRVSGPGGQHRNKVETAVVITHLPTAVRGQATERRSQEENRRAALFRLRTKLAISVRQPRSPGDEPTELWRSRRRGGRLSVSTAHQDFPAILAEALDVLRAHEAHVPPAAADLGITASQLTKFLKQAPEAIAQVNQQREQRGLHPLR